MSAAFALIGIFILLCLTTVISAAESAFFALGPADLGTLKESGTKTDGRILELINKPKRLLATLLISLNFVNIAIVILSSYIMSALFDFSANPTLGFVIQVVSVTFLILVIGEIIPKVYAFQNPLATTRLLAIPTKAFENI